MLCEAVLGYTTFATNISYTIWRSVHSLRTLTSIVVNLILIQAIFFSLALHIYISGFVCSVSASINNNFYTCVFQEHLMEMQVG